MPEINSVGDRDKTLQNLQRALDGAAQRQKIISNNVANVDTPDFKRSDVNFQQALQNSINSGQRLTMSTTDPRHIAGQPSQTGRSSVIQDTSSTFRRDGNNVDIEREIVEMSKNSLYYNAATQMLSDKYKILKTVIADGGGNT